MGKYEDTLADIRGTLGIVPGFMKALPREALENEWQNFKRYELEQTEIPGKYRELIGLAVAANIKCPYCVFFHTAAAKMNGATDAELSELSFLAGLTSRWSAMIHAQHYDYNTFAKETEQIGAHLQKAAGKK